MENKQFLVGASETPFGELDFALVNAPDSDRAVRAYIKQVEIRDELFLSHVYDRAVNMCFAEVFWLQTLEEHTRFNEEGTILLDEAGFSNRVCQFFGEHRDFADKYLAFYWSDGEVDPRQGPFPDEMLAYILANTDWTDLTVVQVSEIKQVQV